MTALGPSLDLQNAVAELLRASADLKALCGNPVRLYQDVPANPKFPYITIGDSQDVPDLAGADDCFLDGSEIFFDLHVWARPPTGGTAQEKQIGAAIRAALPAEVSLTENRNLLLERRNEHHMTEPDTVTLHGVYTFRALVEPVLESG